MAAAVTSQTRKLRWCGGVVLTVVAPPVLPRPFWRSILPFGPTVLASCADQPLDVGGERGRASSPLRTSLHDHVQELAWFAVDACSGSERVGVGSNGIQP